MTDPVEKFKALKAEMRRSGVTPPLLARARAATGRVLGEDETAVPTGRGTLTGRRASNLKIDDPHKNFAEALMIQTGIEYSKSAFDGRPLWRVVTRVTLPEGTVEEMAGQWTDDVKAVNAQAERVSELWSLATREAGLTVEDE